MGREGARPPLPSVLPRNYAGAEVLGAWLAGLASSDTGSPLPTRTLPSLSGAPALAYWPTPYKNKKKNGRKNNGHHKKNEGAHKPKQPKETCSPMACCPECTAPWSCFTPWTPAQQSPPAPHLGGVTHSPHPHSHRARPGTAETRRGPRGTSGALASLLTLLPLIRWGNLGPKAMGTPFGEQRVQPRHSVGKATRGRK